MREVLTYSRRGSRFTPRSSEAWDTYADATSSRTRRSTARASTWPRASTTRAPLAVEIGCGVGEATVALAAARPETNILGIEVWRPGVADCVGRFGGRRAHQRPAVRRSTRCGRWSTSCPTGLAELWTFFPDPWHKTRHHKRRLVTPEFARLVSTRLAPGGTWRLATDWGDYAERMVEVLDAVPDAEGRRRRALGRPAGHPLRAQGRRRRPRHHRPGLPAGLRLTPRRGRASARPGRGGYSRRSRSASRSVPSGSPVRVSGRSTARHASSSTSSYAARMPVRRAIDVPCVGCRGPRGAAAAGRGRSGPAAGSGASRAQAGGSAAGGPVAPRTQSSRPGGSRSCTAPSPAHPR